MRAALARGRTVVAAALVAAVATTPAVVPLPAEARAAAAARPGAYAGNVIEDGAVSPKEKVRFTVTRAGKVTRIRGRVWVVCYTYPNSYSQLPVAFTAPAARIRGGRASVRWARSYTVDGVQYRLTGRFLARFQGKRATGQLSLDFGPCTTRLGDSSLVPFRARRR